MSVHAEEDDEDSSDDKSKDIGTVIGIDLGTTYSWCVQCCFNLLLVCEDWQHNVH